MSQVCVREIMREIERYAPPALQESYDNAGLQVGDKNAPVTAVLLCLDVTEQVIDEAVSLGANLVIAHHPLLFKGLKSITGSSYVERVVMKAIRHDIAIYAAHTNLDNAWNGVNFKIAEKLGLREVQILDPMPGKLLKLVVFVPVSHLAVVQNALFAAGAGEVGNYDNCSFDVEGSGTFRAQEGANPYCGEVGKRHIEREARVEVILPAYAKGVVLTALKESHPYEEPAYDLISLENEWHRAGSGVVGMLETPMDEAGFLHFAKTVFNTKCVKYAGPHDRKIKRVAVCGGAGAFLARQAVASGADAFLTGEIRYHDYFEFCDRILMAEFGHYETEQYTKEIFYSIITKKFRNFAVHYTKVETNPINYL